MKKNQKLEDLIRGMEDLLSKDRCPLTDDEKVLLENCVKELRDPNEKLPDFLFQIENVTKWLLLLFEVGDRIKDAF